MWVPLQSVLSFVPLLFMFVMIYMLISVHALPVEVKRYHSVQTGVYFSRVEVVPVGCQETKFVCRSCYTDLCVSCLSLCPSSSQPGAIYLFFEQSEVIFYWELTTSSPSTKVCSGSCVTVRMQQLVLKVLCSTLLLVAVVPSVYSQSGMGPSSSVLHLLFLSCEHLSIFWSFRNVFVYLPTLLMFPV